ncbi:hypothetical protein AAFF_G00395360, partial [Aldrovandia affinis]
LGVSSAQYVVLNGTVGQSVAFPDAVKKSGTLIHEHEPIGDVRRGQFRGFREGRVQWNSSTGLFSIAGLKVDDSGMYALVNNDAERYKDNQYQLNVDERVCRPCPEGWELSNSKCYYFSTETKSWDASRSDCLKQGADLVIIESKEEQDFISKYRGNGFGSWIGLSDSETEGTWLWVDGTPLQEDKAFWGMGQPNDPDESADCVLTVPAYLFVPEVSAARVYDRQTLLGIRSSMVEFHAFTKLDVFQPPFVRSLVPLRVTCMEATSTKAPADAGGREGNELEHSWIPFAMALYHSWRQILLPPACVPRPGHALLADSSYPGKRSLCLGGRKSRLPVPAPSAQGLCCDCCCWARRPTSQDGSD